MSMPPPESTMQCAHCGNLFRGNPRSQPAGRDNYCSIMCEEGTAQRAIEDPLSPDFHRFLQGNPEGLVGYSLIALGLRLVDYSPDWCRGPKDWSQGVVVWESDEDTLYVLQNHILLGEVVEFEDDMYKIRHVKDNGELSHIRWHDASTVISQIRNDRWWVE